MGLPLCLPYILYYSYGLANIYSALAVDKFILTFDLYKVGREQSSTSSENHPPDAKYIFVHYAYHTYYPPPRFCAQGVTKGSVVLWVVVLVSLKLVI